MAGAAYTIDYDDRQVMQVIDQLMRQMDDLTPVFRDAGEYLVRSTHDRFEAQQDPQGHPWHPLSPAYQASKKRNQDVILVLNGYLYGDIHYEAHPDQLLVGTNRIYGAVMQFGAEKGAFGSTSRGRPIPFGDIPARPYLGMSEEDNTEVLAILNDHLLRATH